MSEPDKPVQTDNRDRAEDPKQTVSQDPNTDYSAISAHTEEDEA